MREAMIVVKAGLEGLEDLEDLVDLVDLVINMVDQEAMEMITTRCGNAIYPMLFGLVLIREDRASLEQKKTKEKRTENRGITV